MFLIRPRVAAVLLAALAAHSLFAALSPEAGAFVFQTYTPKTYGANPQNWAIAQDSRGIMYFGNNDGVLEYDGVFWRLIRLKDAARSLAVDARGRVYVGGRGEFGYLEPDVHGTIHFVALPVPKENKDFLDVWSVVPTSAGVYFGTNFKIFLLTNSGALKVWNNKKGFGRIFAAYGELFVPLVDGGLRRLENDDLAAGPRADPSMGARLAFAAGDRPLLAGRHGLFSFSLSEVLPFPNDASSYIEQNEAYSIRQLSSGDIAVGTKSGGLVLLDHNGGLERMVRQESGLAGDLVAAIYEDREHAIWLATNNGIARFVSSFSSFGEQQSLHGPVISETRFQGSMFAGTEVGAFRMRTMARAEPVFDQIPDLREQVFVMMPHGNELLAGGEHGLYRLTTAKAERLTATEIGAVYDLASSTRDPNLVYSAGRGGVRSWLRAGRGWRTTEPTGVVGQEFRTVVEDPDGTVWSTTRVSIWHFDFSTQPARFQQFTSADGIPIGDKYAYLFRGHLVVATEKGLLRYDAKAGRFMPDMELGPQYADGSRPVSLLREDVNGDVWITGNGYHDLLPKNSRTPYVSPFVRTGTDVLYSIFLDQDGTCWASDAAGPLYRLEKLDLGQMRKPLPTFLRRVGVIGQKEPLFGGDGTISSALSLEHRDNGLRFDFAAPFYDAPTAVEYQYQLDGTDRHWSDWTKENYKEYTNLFEGPYRFHVRMRDPHGTMGGEVAFPFQVMPPLYRTWWAYLTYVTGFLLAGWLILRWRLRSLEARNKWLEGVVEERTAEVRQERDQNEALLLNILPKPVAAELRTNGNVKPTSFDDATVCFSDFVGFTLSSEKLPAETLINALNRYFTAFDEIIGRYGLEKLKTIGDAYMFAGGLPNRRPSHAVDAVLAALEMAAVVNRLRQPEHGVNWQIRLGLYSGPVVSGVVGVRKFAFDIWGNTVNFAARMESAGKPGQVNLSETTFQRVAQFLECEARGPVKIKEGREMEMYFAVGPKAELMKGPLVDGVPQAFREAYEKAFGEPPKSFPAAAILDEWLQASDPK